MMGLPRKVIFVLAAVSALPALGLCAALCLADEPTPFFPATLDSSGESEPQRFQYHWQFSRALPDGGAFVRRVVVERDGPLHGILILTEDGFPLAHLLDNVAMFLSPTKPGEIAFFSGGGFRIHLGVNDERKLGFSLKTVIPADGSRSVCDVTTLLQTLHARSTAIDSRDNGRIGVFLRDQEPFALMAGRIDAETDRTCIDLVSLGNAQGGMNLYGIRTDGDYPLSILKFSPAAKAMQKLEGAGRRLNPGDDFPPELENLCERLNVEDERARLTAESFQLRLARSKSCGEALSKRELVERALDAVPRSGTNTVSSQPLEQIQAALHSAGIRAAQNDALDVRNEGDPYGLTWQAEAVLGPTLVRRIRARLKEVASDPHQTPAERGRAFSLLCRVGWNPTENRSFRELRKELKAASPAAPESFDQGIDWALVEARP